MTEPELEKYRYSKATGKDDDRWYITKKGCTDFYLTGEQADEVIYHSDCHNDLVAELKKSHHIITRLTKLVCHYGYKDELPKVRINERLAALAKVKKQNGK